MNLEMTTRKYCLYILVAVSAISCNVTHKNMEVEIKNDLDLERNEVVSVSSSLLHSLLSIAEEKDIRVKSEATNTYIPLQWIDYDKDGKSDELLFVANVKPLSSAKYLLVADAGSVEPQSTITTYSRFVPERTDDYAWENDKVAFRVYGPTGQKQALEGVAGSTLSSGVDIWLKRTDKPIINKWYSSHVKSPGYYHIDHGEGYDPYHVGNSRGTGGSGIWDKDTLYVSQNFVTHKTIATGPLRTVFELGYGGWGPYNLKETKRISLDLGSNFSRFEIQLASDRPIPNYTVGITLHDNKGETKINKESGWYRHWEKVDDAYLGEAILINPVKTDTAFVRMSDIKDLSNLLVVNKPEDKIIYYAGFAWQKSGQVNTSSDWEAILVKQAQIIKNPLKVTVKN